MDLILGRFADAEIATLRDDELGELERLIRCPDPSLCGADGRQASRLNMRVRCSIASRRFRAVDPA